MSYIAANYIYLRIILLINELKNTIMIKKVKLIGAFMLLSSCVFAQTGFLHFSQNEMTFQTKMPVRTVEEKGTNKLILEYQFPGALVSQQTENGINFQNIFIEGFSHLKEVGKPALPSHTDIIALPKGIQSVSIKVLSYEKKEYDGYMVYPALQPASDRWGDPEPEFEMDTEFYNSDIFYPEASIKLVEINKIRGMNIAFIQICPVHFNPIQQKIIVYSKIKYKIVFKADGDFIDRKSSISFLKSMPNFILNDLTIKNEINLLEQNRSRSESLRGESKNYIIITHSKYKQAADSLAHWKMQLGYKVEIISKAFWTAEDVRKEIKTRYDDWNPKPDYFVIIGDNEDVPGDKITAPSNNDFHTDLYFACMDGEGDYVPDIAHGRISVSYAGEANILMQKIINYERKPYVDTDFYNTGLNCAQYQDDNKNGYADRRFSLTSENVKDYMENEIGIEVNRVYAADPEVIPRYWNNTYYADGEPLDSSLLKPGFAWDGTNTDIAGYINSGTFYVLHRDHGYAGGTGWHMPQFKTDAVKSLLNNGNKLPVVFSINCNTGEFQLPECFAEAFLRKPSGGAAGIFAAAYISYSGYNDALTMGFFDAIWSNPGLIPDFTGSQGIKNPNVTPHEDIFTMGDVLNQGLLRMVETWGTSKYTFELFHYFGDPAMRIITENPQPINNASHNDTIVCNSTFFDITNCSIADGLVTLVVDGELIAMDTLDNGNVTLNFPAIAGDLAYLTISKHNYIPYVALIPIIGGCPKSRFESSSTNYCVDNPILFTNKSSGNINSFLWDFGEGANPATATTEGPHQINYATAGIKTISLKTTGPAGTSEWEMEIDINENCEFFNPYSGSATITNCTGVLYDNGGTGLYSNNTDGSITIAPPKASSITLVFKHFDFELDYDSLLIYDGPNKYAPLIGSYTGFDLPNGGIITSSASSITLRQMTDPGLQKSGYELLFYCNESNAAPISNFFASTQESCNGLIYFTDMSRNAPDNWLWNFGDGHTSTDKNPVHTYSENGMYTVQLKSWNSYGADSFIRTDYISVSFPEAPYVVNGSSCGNGIVELQAIGQGTVEWYDSLANGELLGKGNYFKTPYLLETTTYYAQINERSYKIGPENNTMGTGGIFSYTNEHGVIFTAHKPLFLHSVYVYASGGKNRTIELKDANDVVLSSKIVFIEGGESRIDLDIEIPVGSGLKLVSANGCDLYRNRSGAIYPYEIPGIISITGSTAAQAGYYYFFYDWDISEKEECLSERIPVIAHIHQSQAIADFDMIDSGLYYRFINTSTDVNHFRWDFGDGQIDTMNYHCDHKYQESGDFEVTLTVDNGCGSDSLTKNMTVVNALDELKLKNDISLYPNPNNGNFVLVIERNDYEFLRISDMNGKLVYESKINSLRMVNPYSIESGIDANGMYLIQLISKNEVFQKLFMVE